MNSTEEFFAAEDAAAREQAKPNGHGGGEPLNSDLPPLRITDPTRFQGQPLPPRRWVVADWIPWGLVTGMYGPGGTGKSLLVQQLMTSTAIGQRWIGFSTTPVKSFAVFCEDSDDELQRRQADINRLYGIDFCDLGNMRWVSRLGEDNIMMHFDNRGRAELTPFFHQTLEAAKDFGAQLFLIDTVADAFGGNYNDPGQVRQFVQQGPGKIAREIGAALSTLHPSRAGQNSGEGDGYSQQWDAAFRSRLYFVGDDKENHNARTLTRKKSNYAARNEKIEMRWQDGVFVPISTPTGIIGSIERRTCERVFLDLLDKATAEGQHLSHNSRIGNYAPRVFEKRPDRERFGKADFERAMQALFVAKQIAVGFYRGPSRHDHECIVRTAPK